MEGRIEWGAAAPFKHEEGLAGAAWTLPPTGEIKGATVLVSHATLLPPLHLALPLDTPRMDAGAPDGAAVAPMRLAVGGRSARDASTTSPVYRERAWCGDRATARASVVTSQVKARNSISLPSMP
mmetsp:Transcript_12193/g.40072  ORF Transcript_12193/g.40072 Transcript_12193/m.40072 type:complete len:125 (-) Transcript_12193:850-1224(-)|eukprot:scaffold308_cov120-Isochrysis_galbana.AAC.2